MDSSLWQLYEDGKAYHQQMGFPQQFPEFVRFKEGKQWAAPTARTRNLPRPVFNIIEMFIRTKRAAVLSQPVSITYMPEETVGDHAEAEQNARKLSEFVRQLWEHLNQDALNSRMMDDAATLGTGVLHYYYDASVVGGKAHCPSLPVYLRQAL